MGDPVSCPQDLNLASGLLHPLSDENGSLRPVFQL